MEALYTSDVVFPLWREERICLHPISFLSTKTSILNLSVTSKGPSAAVL